MKSVIQIQKIILLCENDADFMRAMYSAFIQQNKGVIEDLQRCMHNHDTIEAKKIIHKLKSSFGILGVTACNYEIELSQSEVFLSMSYADFCDIIQKIIEVFVHASQEYTIFIQNLQKT